MTYPLPNACYTNQKKERINKLWRPSEADFLAHICIFYADFSEKKMTFAIAKVRSRSAKKLRKTQTWEEGHLKRPQNSYPIRKVTLNANDAFSARTNWKDVSC